jgi:hypothetical protein
MAKTAAKSPRRKRLPPDEPIIDGMPAELVAVRLIRASVAIHHAAIEQFASEGLGFLDTETEVTIRPGSITATLQLRCRVATEDRANILLDATLRHRLDYQLRPGGEGHGEHMARQNALFAIWPFWRAMLADFSGQAGVRILALPLLLSGQEKLTSGFDMAPPGAALMP